MGIKDFFNRRKHAHELTQHQKVQGHLEQIQNEVITTVSNSFGAFPSLPEPFQQDYDDLIKRDELLKSQFLLENNVSKDEETQLIYFEVDYEKELQEFEEKCETYRYDANCFNDFCACLDELKDFCSSHGRIGELYFKAHYGHDKELFEQWIAGRKYWDTLPGAVEAFIKENSPVLQTAIWSKFPRGISFVKQHVKELEAKGFILREKQGRTFLITWIG